MRKTITVAEHERLMEDQAHSYELQLCELRNSIGRSVAQQQPQGNNQQQTQQQRRK